MFRIWFERDMPEYVWPLIEGRAEPIGPGTATPHDLLEAIGPADAVIASSLITYDASVMDRAPRLQVIARTGIGYDKVDVAAATERGVAVCNAPDAPTTSTAEHAMALLLSVAKRIPTAQAALREGGRDFFASHQGIELTGLRLGLVGMGRIGTAVATMAAAFAMPVIAYDPFVDDSTLADQGIRPAGSLEAVLAEADVVSLHVPLTDDTRHLLDAERIAQMKRGSILINTARGGLVDHDALLAALDRRELGGAGLDTTEPEPLPPDHPLLHRQGVVVTPHIAAATGAAKVRLYESAVTQALQVLSGDEPQHLVNRDVWPVRRRFPDTKETAT
jgi:D-3-phosphoglycerate dehydrogenase / 2-oxoglutarate reductase